LTPGGEGPADVVGQVDHQFADLVLGEFAVGQGGVELDVDQVRLALGGQDADAQEPAGRNVEVGPAPHVTDEVVDRVGEEVARAEAGSAENP
jgi:hypothetical protein